MCGIAEAGLAMGIMSALTSAYGLYQQGQAQKSQADYSAKVSEENAKVAEVQAKDAENRGANDAATMRENYVKANASARAAAGSSGLLADTGTMGQIQDQNVELGEMNVLTARNNAAREAWGYRVQGANYVNQASLDRASGRSAATSGLISGIGGVMSAGEKAGNSKWLQKQFAD